MVAAWNRENCSSFAALAVAKHSCIRLLVGGISLIAFSRDASAKESVGIISHGFVFMTAMMELNETWPGTG